MQHHHLWPPVIHWRRIITVTLGVAFGVGLILLATDVTHHLLVAASFGASSLILFGFPDSAFAQPRNFIGGNILCVVIALATYHFLGTTWWSVAMVSGIAAGAMMLTDTVHPPAASHPLTISILHSGWSFLMFPDLAGAILVLLAALLFHRLTRKQYPLYWI